MITSFSETNSQYTSTTTRPLSFQLFKKGIHKFWKRLKNRCGEGCSSGGRNLQDEINSEYMMMRSLSSNVACRRHFHDMYALERNHGSKFVYY